MSLLDDAMRMQFAALLTGISIVEFQLRVVEQFIGPTIAVPPLRLVSDLHGIAVDPNFIKDK